MPAFTSASVVLALMCAALVCTAADERSRRIRSVATATVMAVAMTDAMLTHRVPIVVWVTVLVVAGIWSGARRTAGERGHDLAMRAHRAISCIAMAALIALPTSPGGSHHHGSALPLAAVLVLALTTSGVVITALALRHTEMDVRSHRSRRLLSAAEPTLMGASMAVMFA